MQGFHFQKPIFSYFKLKTTCKNHKLHRMDKLTFKTW